MGRSQNLREWINRWIECPNIHFELGQATKGAQTASSTIYENYPTSLTPEVLRLVTKIYI
jgi:hypothetical protein